MPISTPTWYRQAGTPAQPQFAEYVIRGHSVESDGGSKPFVNILHFARVAGPGTGTEAQLYAAVSALIDAALSTALSVAYVSNSTDVRFMDDPIRAAVVNANAIAAAKAGDRLPNYAAVVIRKKTSARGRSYMGSNHWGPISEADTTLDNITGGGLADWNAVNAALTSLFGPGNVTLPTGDLWKLAVFSPTLSDLTVSPILLTGAICTNLVTNKRLGTMRRRKDRTGPST